MKKLIALGIFLLIIGCGNPAETETEPPKYPKNWPSEYPCAVQVWEFRGLIGTGSGTVFNTDDFRELDYTIEEYKNFQGLYVYNDVLYSFNSSGEHTYVANEYWPEIYYFVDVSGGAWNIPVEIFLSEPPKRWAVISFGQPVLVE